MNIALSFSPVGFAGGGLGSGDSFEILICRLLGVLRQYVEVNETLQNTAKNKTTFWHH